MTATARAYPFRRPSKYGSAHCWFCQACDIVVDAANAKSAACLKCGATVKSKDLIHFDSKRERTRWGELRALDLLDCITDLQRQVSYPIEINGTKVGSYRGDFQYRENGQVKIEDVKGVDTPLSRFKRKCVTALYGTEIQIVK